MHLKNIIVIKKFIVLFIFSLCSVTVAKAKLEYNPLMDWYYWVEEMESETYRYHEDDILDEEVTDSSSSKKQYSTNFNLNDDFIRNMQDIRTRQFRVIGAVTANGKVYYKNNDGSFHRGWKEEGGYWYYFDPIDLALVTTALKDIDGKVYYFNDYGQMMTNTVIEIAGYKINIDGNGWCSIIE